MIIAVCKYTVDLLRPQCLAQLAGDADGLSAPDHQRLTPWDIMLFQGFFVAHVPAEGRGNIFRTFEKGDIPAACFYQVFRRHARPGKVIGDHVGHHDIFAHSVEQHDRHLLIDDLLDMVVARRAAGHGYKQTVNAGPEQGIHGFDLLFIIFPGGAYELLVIGIVKHGVHTADDP